MGHVVDGKNILTQRPEPGRPVQSEVIKETTIIEKESQVDVKNIAEAVVEALGDKLSNVIIQTTDKKFDSFDDKGTMEQLAKSMTVQRGDSSSNFDELGNVSETKKDKEEVDETINLLKGLED